MELTSSQIGTVIVFFFYGLSFFTMGIAVALESTRSPMLAERRVIRPLAAFGLMHGIHEWLEIIIVQSGWLGKPFPPSISIFRVIWLAASFIPLIVFGFLAIHPRWRPVRIYVAILIILLVSIMAYLVVAQLVSLDDLIKDFDALTRYILAVPGGIVACIGLWTRAKRVSIEGREKLAHAFRLAALAFLLYGFTQVFVSKNTFFPSNLINTELFISIFHFPIQVIRAILALGAMINLLSAINFVENEREEQLLAAQKARLEALEQIRQELIIRENMRRDLLRHIVIAQEDERTRIARELHDETAQTLTAFSLNLATLQNLKTKSKECAPIIDNLQSLSKQMSKGLYRLVHDLRPAQLDDLGLVSTLEFLVRAERQQNDLEVNLEITGQRQRLDPVVETAVFRVVQEALSNVRRHAQVKQASLQIIFSPGQARVIIQDHGVGFDPAERITPPKGWGLAGMRERIEAVDGVLHIDSAPGKGTIIEVTVNCANC